MGHEDLGIEILMGFGDKDFEGEGADRGFGGDLGTEIFAGFGDRDFEGFGDGDVDRIWRYRF